jgi:hypothetical protein
MSNLLTKLTSFGSWVARAAVGAGIGAGKGGRGSGTRIAGSVGRSFVCCFTCCLAYGLLLYNSVCRFLRSFFCLGRHSSMVIAED